MKYVLKNQAGEYYSLAVAMCVSKDQKKATLFDTKQEAIDWRDQHSLFPHKLKDLGFTVYERKDNV